MGPKLEALATGLLITAVAFAALHLARPTPYPGLTARLFPPPSVGSEINLVLTQLYASARAGVAVGFLVFVGRNARGRLQANRLAAGAAVGLGWLLVVGFVQDLLLALHFPVASGGANTFWLVASAASFFFLVCYVARSLTERRT
jgi:hypothetical protein